MVALASAKKLRQELTLEAQVKLMSPVELALAYEDAIAADLIDEVGNTAAVAEDRQRVNVVRKEFNHRLDKDFESGMAISEIAKQYATP